MNNPDHLDAAIYATVHADYNCCSKLASITGIGRQVLINKANPNNTRFKMSVRDAVNVMKASGDRRILRAIELELGIDEKETHTIDDILHAVLQASCEHGDVVRVIQEATADGKFTLREKEQCQQEIDEAIEALNKLRAAIVVAK
jgi:hypothetical protein